MTKLSALIIIDMQKGMRSPTLPPRYNPQAEDNIARLHAAWRESGQPVISVRHISRSPASVFAPGQGGAEFQERFLPLPHEHVVEKNVPDAFIHTSLERWLHARAIRHLVIAGVSTNNSVAADACFAFDKQDFDGTWRSAEEVHLMALANLHGGVCAADILKR